MPRAGAARATAAAALLLVAAALALAAAPAAAAGEAPGALHPSNGRRLLQKSIPEPDAQQNMDPWRRSVLRLPPFVYLGAFLLLLTTMALLLTCHCVRLCRLAQRYDPASGMRPPSPRVGVVPRAWRAPSDGGAGAGGKRGAPRDVVAALPVLPYEVARRQQCAPGSWGGNSGSGGGPSSSGAGDATGDGSGGSGSGAVVGVPVSETELQPLPPAAAQQTTAGAAGAGHSASSSGSSSAAGAEACCIICYDEFARADPVRQLPCGHVFHIACADAWLTRDASCPVCRSPVCGPAAGADKPAGGDGGGDEGGDGGGTGRRRPPLRRDDSGLLRPFWALHPDQEELPVVRPWRAVVPEVVFGSVGLAGWRERVLARREERRAARRAAAAARAQGGGGGGSGSTAQEGASAGAAPGV